LRQRAGALQTSRVTRRSPSMSVVVAMRPRYSCDLLLAGWFGDPATPGLRRNWRQLVSAVGLRSSRRPALQRTKGHDGRLSPAWSFLRSVLYVGVRAVPGFANPQSSRRRLGGSRSHSNTAGRCAIRAELLHRPELEEPHADKSPTLWLHARPRRQSVEQVGLSATLPQGTRLPLKETTARQTSRPA
jgi:hypothetical protein